MAWLEQVDVAEDFVLMMDTDMYLRKPIDPLAMGCARGTVVSAKYSYLYGITSGFARHFIDEALHERMAGVGGFHIFHREDLRQIAPLWLEYTKKVRAFGHAEPEAFFRESMQLPPDIDEATTAVRRKQAMWHSEMYGYVFAAAQVGVTHKVRRDVMLYPGYQPFLGRPPMVLHYGSDFTVDGAYFNKMVHTRLKLETCPAFLFDMPKTTRPEDYAGLSARDGLCVEHLSLMNAAFCRFYRKLGCEAIPPACADGGLGFSEGARRAALSQGKCVDEQSGCASWAAKGECTKNPGFMYSACSKACGSCNKSIDELLPHERWHGDWKHAAQERGEPIDARGGRPMPQTGQKRSGSLRRAISIHQALGQQARRPRQEAGKRAPTQ